MLDFFIRDLDEKLKSKVISFNKKKEQGAFAISLRKLRLRIFLQQILPEANIGHSLPSGMCLSSPPRHNSPSLDHTEWG
ncbi:hypothetical protein CEXT_330921 [Caerostris extrusa]|uniref:Uncharacterized protein n=1 Tax=Caerostris extrusa TaxID=172846 RepID=A0AAV4TM49_CAEEX|nr:hypothetical protein CEXT_330921 [Caerostris extrusa]